MNIRCFMLPFILSLGLTSLFGGKLSAETQTTPSTSPPSQEVTQDSKCQNQGEKSFESIRLYYLRSAKTIKEILSKIVGVNGCKEETVVEAQGDNEIVLYGSQEQREELQRIIAILDLPREGVSMEMWGIRISSDNPEQLAEAMREVNQQIDKTQRLLQYTYKRLEDYAREIEIDGRFSNLFQHTLKYQTALDNNDPSLSMIDILLRMNAASAPIANYNDTAKNLRCLFEEEEYQPYIKALQEEYASDEQAAKEEPKKIPFGNYFRVGLHQDKLNPDKSSALNCDENLESRDKKDRVLSKKEKEVCLENLRARGAVLDFALQYSYLKQEPENFNPDSLQQSAENLESVLHPIVDAINRDVKELFIEPTLAEIQSIVSEYDDVEYAEVGKTTVAGLNGIQSTVSSTSVSAFEENPPLRLNELLEDANINANDLLPGAGTNAIPAASVAKLIAALSKDRSLWRELTSGVTLNITPSVLRNSTSAELEVDLTTGPGEAGTREEGVRPLSRISQNTVNTSVYVNTLDIFALSTFNNQATIDGGRTYIPIIGTIWEGIFSGIPVFGDLFSWQNAPKNVQHQSIVLTNSFIVPTAMGLAPLYSETETETETKTKNEDDFKYRSGKVEEYKSKRRREIEREQSSGEQNLVFRPQKTKDCLFHNQFPTKTKADQ